MAVTGTPQARTLRAKGKQATPFDRISGWLTLAANLGVLLGLALVLLQLNQNERMIRAQTRHDIATGIVELLVDTAGNQQLSEVLYRGSIGAPLTPAEQFQHVQRTSAVLRLWEDVHYQYRMGLYDEEEFSKERETWKAMLGSNEGVLDQWCETRGRYSTEFAKDMDGLIGPRACQAPP